MIRRVPLAVPPPEASRHFVTPAMVTCSSPAPVVVHRWLAPPLQPHSWTTTPSALLLPFTSRHLPDAEFTSVLAVIAASAPGIAATVARAAAATVQPATSAWRRLILIGVSQGTARGVG